MIIWIIIGVVVLGAVVGLLAYLKNKNEYRFKFVLHSRDGHNAEVVKAKITKNPNNKKMEFFTFKNNTSSLSVQQPSRHMDGKAIRDITYDTTGAYVYLTSFAIDDTNSLKKSLNPLQKSLSLYQFQENQRKHPVLDKVGITQIVASVIMVVIVMIGVIYGVGMIVKNSSDMITVTKEMRLTAESLYASSQSQEIVSLKLAEIYASLNGGELVTHLSAQD